jgi:hypothetical protein
MTRKATHKDSMNLWQNLAAFWSMMTQRFTNAIWKLNRQLPRPELAIPPTGKINQRPHRDTGHHHV